MMFILAAVLLVFFYIAWDRGWAQQVFKEVWLIVRHPVRCVEDAVHIFTEIREPVYQGRHRAASA